MHVNAYLHFDGQCAEAFKFYEQCLGGKIEALLAHEGTPAAKCVPDEWRKKIMHARLVVGDQALMGCDAPPEHYRKPAGFSVSLDVKEPREAERIFQELAKNGSVQMPIQETFWAVRFGMTVDRFGVPWIINCATAA